MDAADAKAATHKRERPAYRGRWRAELAWCKTDRAGRDGAVRRMFCMTSVYRMVLIAAAALGLALFGTVSAKPAPAVQGAPATDIFFATLHHRPGAPVLGGLVRATDRAGYDNQPAFLSGGNAFFYTSIDGAGQSDIYRYTLADHKAARVTRTSESEFSPTPLPDGSGFATVTVEKNNAQRLWAYDMDGSHPRLLRTTPSNIGYFAWVGADPADVLAFLVQKPLVAARLEPGKPAHVVAMNPGRCLRPVPTTVSAVRAVSLVVKRDSRHWELVMYDPETGKLRDLVAMPAGSEDFAWTPDGWLIAPSGRRLLAWHAGSKGWQTLADLTKAVPGDISRLAVSPDGAYIAFVVARPTVDKKAR